MSSDQQQQQPESSSSNPSVPSVEKPKVTMKNLMFLVRNDWSLVRRHHNILLKHFEPQHWNTPFGRERETVFFQACLAIEDLCVDDIKLMIAHGADVHSVDRSGGDFLCNLSYHRRLNVKLFEFAESLGFSAATSRDRCGTTPMHIMCQVASPDLPRLIEHVMDRPGISGPAIFQARDCNGYTPLYEYCRSHRIGLDTLKNSFLRHGAVIDQTVLREIASRSNLLMDDLLRTCLRLYVPIDPSTDSDRFTTWRGEGTEHTLSFICLYNPEYVVDPIVQLLFEYGHSLETPHSLFTPLMHLCNNLKSTAQQILCLIRNGARFGGPGVKRCAYDILLHHRGQEFVDAIIHHPAYEKALSGFTPSTDARPHDFVDCVPVKRTPLSNGKSLPDVNLCRFRSATGAPYLIRLIQPTLAHYGILGIALDMPHKVDEKEDRRRYTELEIRLVRPPYDRQFEKTTDHFSPKFPVRDRMTGEWDSDAVVFCARLSGGVIKGSFDLVNEKAARAEVALPDSMPMGTDLQPLRDALLRLSAFLSSSPPPSTEEN